MQPASYAWYEFGVRLSQADLVFIADFPMVTSHIEGNAPRGRGFLRRLRQSAEWLTELSNLHRKQIEKDLDDADVKVDHAVSGNCDATLEVAESLKAIRSLIAHIPLPPPSKDAYHLGWQVPRFESRSSGERGGPAHLSQGIASSFAMSRKWCDANEVARLLDKVGLHEKDVLVVPDEWSREVIERLGGPSNYPPGTPELERLMIEEGLLRLKSRLQIIGSPSGSDESSAKKTTSVSPSDQELHVDFEKCQIFFNGVKHPVDPSVAAYVSAVYNAAGNWISLAEIRELPGGETISASSSVTRLWSGLPEEVQEVIETMSGKGSRWLRRRS